VGGGPRLARSQIREAVRTTRRHAMREKAPAVVLIDEKKNSFAGVGWKTVGNWHFESAEGGRSPGFPVDADADEYQIAPGGVIGNCLDLTETGGTGVLIPPLPSLNAVSGISLELFVRVLASGPRNLIAKGDFYALRLDEDGRLVGELKLVQAGSNTRVTRNLYQIVSDDYVLPPRRWVRASMHFNGYSCVLSADGIVLEEEEFPQRMRILTDRTSPIQIGNPMEPFGGYVDEVRIGTAVTGDEMVLPETVHFDAASGRIHFDRYGHLDRRHHTQPFKIELRYAEEKAGTLTIGLYGEIW
jgi:hypothetical protein